MNNDGQSQHVQQAMLLQALQSLQTTPPQVQQSADMDAEDLALANMALPNLSTAPASSSNSGQ
eukprot:10552250-Karenia_brevis.AAC.1